jgi:hypothetical protein
MSRCRASRCPVCGCQTLVDEYTEAGVYAPHAALPATERVRAAHPGKWPTCEHGALYRAGCRNQPVLPACCCAPSPLLPSVPAHLEVP